MTGVRRAAPASTASSASTRRGRSKSAGCRSSRSSRPAASAPARTPSAERRSEQRRRDGRALAADEAQQRRPPVEVGRQLAAQRGRVGVRGRDEAARPEAGEHQHPASASMLARVASASMCANSASGPWRRSRPAGPARRCWKPCCAIASPRSRQSSSQAARSGRRWKNGCRSGAGITSSVARSMPWSASQSRISAQRSNVAGSTSWIATAMRRSRAPRAPRSVRRGRHAASARRAPSGAQRAAPARGEAGQRGLPGALAHRRQPAAGEPLAHRARARQPGDRAAQRLGARRAQQAAAAVGDQLRRAARGDRDHRQAGRLRLEHDLAERVGRRAEQEDVGRGVRRGQRVALEPAEERRRAPEPRAQPLLLRPAAGEHEVQARVARARGEERVREQVDALLAASRPA